MKQGTLLTLWDPLTSSLPKLYLHTSGWAEGRACRTPARRARPGLWGGSARHPQCFSRDVNIHIYRRHHRSVPPFIPSSVVSYLSRRVVSFLPHISHADESQRQVSQPELSVVTQEVRTQDGHLEFQQTENCMFTFTRMGCHLWLRSVFAWGRRRSFLTLWTRSRSLRVSIRCVRLFARSSHTR